MPTYKYEAMDTSGGEVKDSVEAMSEEEAQQKIRQMGYFVTKITEMAGAKKAKGKKGAQEKEGPNLHHRRRLQQESSAPSRASSRPCKTPACRCCAVCASSNIR